MPTRAVLLVNLGSPDSPTEADVRRYLREFLMDGRVLDAPWPIRFYVVHFTILPSRPRESAHAYSKIWTDDGSPLVVTSRRMKEQLQRRLSMPVELAMRYQHPSIEETVKSRATQGVTETFLIPLFPHYAMSSYETAVVPRSRLRGEREDSGRQVLRLVSVLSRQGGAAPTAASCTPWSTGRKS
jgi:protoporphyrin/coproporphyrin ferrochelatase